MKKSPIFEGVSLDRFMKALNRVLKASPEEKFSAPEELARMLEQRPFEAWAGGARFGALQNDLLGPGWAWAYETVKTKRLLIWSSPGTVYTVGMENSKFFKGDLEELFGTKASYDEDFVLDREEINVLWAERPCITCQHWQDDDRQDVDNEDFFSIVFPTIEKKNISPTIGDLIGARDEEIVKSFFVS